MADKTSSDAKAAHPVGHRFFGRRIGRPLTPLRKNQVEKLMPSLGITGEGQVLADKVKDPAALFSTERTSPITKIALEVGFGAGEHLAWQAEHNPNIGFIGCEPFLNGVARLVGEIDDKKITNIRLFTDDARLLLAGLPDNCIDQLYILFPDPWPKTKHKPRRIINEENLIQYARILKSNAQVRFASDHSDYVRWMLYYTLKNGSFIWQDEGPSDWRHRKADWPPTRYEEKALAGYSTYLSFTRAPR